jgi:hypothetical protein
MTSITANEQLYVENRKVNANSYAVNTPAELASVFINSKGKTLGKMLEDDLKVNPVSLQNSTASMAATGLANSVKLVDIKMRDVSAVKLSLNYLANRNVGDLNLSFKTTLDAFSYRLDAWYSARANQRLEQLRTSNPTGIYVGSFAWVENLKADLRPDSDGYVLAPSLGQAATASILRSGFLANKDQGVFNIELNSKRTRQALDILQGLTRDQPLAALYGYQVERSLRDAGLGKYIYPLRLLYPWRVTGASPEINAEESIGARDVVDGVALLEAFDPDAGNKVCDLLKVSAANERTIVKQILTNVFAVADSVSDLLMAEGVYQIVQGNFDRASAAMAVVDKQ